MLLAEKKLFLIIKSVRTLCEVRVEHTAGLPISKTHKKHQFADKPEGLRQFRDHHWKALGKENSATPNYSHSQKKIVARSRGLRQIRDHHWKALGKENSDLFGLFLLKHYC